MVTPATLEPTEVIEIRDPEVDVDALMTIVRANVARRLAEGAYREDLDAIANQVFAEVLTKPEAAAGIIQEDQNLAAILAELNTRWMVSEVPFRSNAPVVGPLIVAIRSAWNWMSTKWYVRPLIHQLVSFNAVVVRAFSESVATQQKMADELHQQQAELKALREEIELLRKGG